ncbi:hypothetical protein [Pseudonocardia sp. H11422]|uniref:hypothetical protein n=1 Tax=Pseudonocardia sp. H11422 TaxID=2835866 RepID=UPI0027E24CC2|nr:hypothetical protein [Pseudonocardia sp. H11422]
MADLAVWAGLGIVLALIGRWGRRNAADLTPSTLPADERHRREGVLRRGGAACQVVGLLFVGAGIVATVL